MVSPRNPDPDTDAPSAFLNLDADARDHFSEPNTPLKCAAEPEVLIDSSPAKATTRTFLRSLLSDQEHRLLAAEAEVELLRQQLLLEQQVATSMLVEAASKQQQLAHAPS